MYLQYGVSLEKELANATFVIMKVMRWRFLSFLGIDVFLPVTNGIEEELLYCLCKYLFN